MTEYCALALYIEPDKTLKEAAEMIEALFTFEDDRDLFSKSGEIEVDDAGLSLTIEFEDDRHFYRAKRIREKAKGLGFKEDWDEMNDWDGE